MARLIAPIRRYIVHGDHFVSDVDRVFKKSNAPQHILYPGSEVSFADGIDDRVTY